MNFDPIADQILVDFDFVGIEQGIDVHNVAGGGFDRDRAVGVVDGNSGLGTHIETIFLMGFG